MSAIPWLLSRICHLSMLIKLRLHFLFHSSQSKITREYLIIYVAKMLIITWYIGSAWACKVFPLPFHQRKELILQDTDACTYVPTMWEILLALTMRFTQPMTVRGCRDALSWPDRSHIMTKNPKSFTKEVCMPCRWKILIHLVFLVHHHY